MKDERQYSDSAKMEFWSLVGMIICVIVMLIFNGNANPV